MWTEVEPIISEELWERCNAILQAQTAGRKPAKKVTYLFSGYAVCLCGQKMYVPARRNKYVCPKCRNKIPVEDLENVYHSELSDFMFSPDELAAHEAAANEALREKEALIEAADGELRRLVIAENELFELYHAGALAKADFGRRHRPISERRAQLDEELPRLQAERDVLKIGMTSREEVLDSARDLSARWADLPWEQRRQIVETITDRIVIGTDEVEVCLIKNPFGDSGQMAAQPKRFCVSRDERP